MSKELTPLQKLNNLYAILCHYANKCGVGGAYTEEECGFNAFELKKDIEKELKALEIIKKKQVNVGWLMSSKCLDDYNLRVFNELTQEEYDLLKEVLL